MCVYSVLHLSFFILKTRSLLRSNHCTRYSPDRLHLRRRDRALRCCASTVALSDAVQRLCSLDLCARATLCLDALFTTPLALHTRFEDNACVVTLDDTGHGVFQLVEQIRCVGGEIRVFVAKGFENSEPIERFIAETAVALNGNSHKDCVRLMRMLSVLGFLSPLLLCALHLDAFVPPRSVICILGGR